MRNVIKLLVFTALAAPIFLFSHSHQIAKIAMVGEPRWEAEALAFAGAGFRRAPVKYFSPEQQAAARTWLSE